MDIRATDLRHALRLSALSIVWSGVAGSALLPSFALAAAGLATRTNLIAIWTPHGSLATILCHRLAARRGVRVGTWASLGAAWRYAWAAGLPALGALLLVR